MPRPSRRDLVLAMIEGDPLDLERRARRRVREGAFLVPPHRLLPRCIALVAAHAFEFDGASLDRWLGRIARRAVLDVVEQQRADELGARSFARTGTNGDAYALEEDAHHYASVATRLGVPIHCGRAACVALNRAPLDVRRPFVEIRVRGKSIDRYASEHGVGALPIRRALDAARRTILDAVRAARSAARSIG